MLPRWSRGLRVKRLSLQLTSVLQWNTVNTDTERIYHSVHIYDPCVRIKRAVRKNVTDT